MVVLAVFIFIVMLVLTASSSPQLRSTEESWSTSSATPKKIVQETKKIVQETAEHLYPLFNYTYDKIGNTAIDKPKARDPCFDISLPDDGHTPQKSRNTLVLVTGGAGFIGSNLVDRLLELGYKVRIFDNLYTGYLRNVPLAHEGVEFSLGDILNPDSLSKAVEGVEYIYHLAAMSKVLPSTKDPDMARFCTESNALGSWNVLNAARRAGKIKKVVYAASSTFYGNKPPPHQEDMAPDFLTPYAASKYEGEIQMQMFDRLFEVPTISTRFFMVYGPRQPSTGAYAIVTGVFAKQAADDQPLTIEGDGTHYRDFIHVSDIVNGLILSQQAGHLRGKVVNLGSGSSFSVQNVADLISKNQKYVAERKNDLIGTLADTCRMKKLLGYKAKADFNKEMGYMAKQTMQGNVFMQPWLTSIHALSTPHLLAPGTPLFNWPAKQDDLDALLLALRRVGNRSEEAENFIDRRVSIVPFSSEDKQRRLADNLLLNTIFSLVRFGGVRLYIVAATNDVALEDCMFLNLPCYDARRKTKLEIIKAVLQRGYDVHYAKLGNSYISNVDSFFNHLRSEDGAIDIAVAEAKGDVFVRANDRTREELELRSKSKSARAEDYSFTIDDWGAGSDLKKAVFPVQSVCNSSAGTDTEPSPSWECQGKFYAAVECVDEYVDANRTVNALREAGLWHLTDCRDQEHCDWQQVVPVRWVQQPPDLEFTGGLCK